MISASRSLRSKDHGITIMLASKRQSENSISLPSYNMPPSSIVSLSLLCTLLPRPANAGSSYHKYIFLPLTRRVSRPTTQNIRI